MTDNHRQLAVTFNNQPTFCRLQSTTVVDCRRQSSTVANCCQFSVDRRNFWLWKMMLIKRDTMPKQINLF